MIKQIRSKRLFSFLLAIGLCVCVLLGCRFFSKTNMFEGTAAKDAADAFRKKLGGPVKALSLEIEHDSATLKAQDPQNPQNVDEYKYVKGLVMGPTPVKLNLLENNLDKTLFNLDDINLAATPTVARTAIERVKIDGGKVKKMTIERGLSLATDMTKSGAVHWNIDIEGTRESASAVADTKGNILGLDLSQTARAAKFSTYSADTLRDAAPQIKEAFGGHVKLLELIVYDKYLWFKAKSPRNGEITQYKYDINGVTTSALSNMSDPTPIEVRTGQFKIEDLYFDFDEVNLTLAPDLAKKALERLNFPDGKVSLFEISRKPRKFMGKDLVTVWDVSCQQGRKSASVYYDLAGNEVEVNR
ncbi:MAG TPA: hypothetical protein VEM96_03985 [Pyrinomonadaceae bacterium]|nr:hypothetical protein [Pyrinomonadaceae bacterium]